MVCGDDVSNQGRPAIVRIGGNDCRLGYGWTVCECGFNFAQLDAVTADPTYDDVSKTIGASLHADVIDATSGVVALDSVPTTGISCTSGSYCFRVWVKQNASAVAVDSGCP